MMSSKRVHSENMITDALDKETEALKTDKAADRGGGAANESGKLPASENPSAPEASETAINPTGAAQITAKEALRETETEALGTDKAAGREDEALRETETEALETDKAAGRGGGALPGLYIHIPFCVRKCRYCAFLSGPANDEAISEYVGALKRELRSYSSGTGVASAVGDNEVAGLGDEAPHMEMDDRVFDSIYFGGGTPSILEPAVIGELIELARESYRFSDDLEITLEVNPGTLGDDEAAVRKRLAGYRAAGVNRISMGVQSMDNKRLMFLGRIHSAEEVARDFALARDCGFDNISLDLITAVPGMSLSDALSDIRAVAALGPDHISMYTLQLEEGTPLYRAWERGEFEILSDEADREMYHEGVKLLKELGYDRYEISSFARDKSKRSRHNSKYWCMAEYLGAGLGASGFINGTRYVNTSDMAEYLEGRWRIEEHRNSLHDNISEAVFTGLRRSEGVAFAEVMRFAGEASGPTSVLDSETAGGLACDSASAKASGPTSVQTPETAGGLTEASGLTDANSIANASANAADVFWDYYKDIKSELLEFQKDGYIIIDERGMRLTDSGIDISNTIMALFV